MTLLDQIPGFEGQTLFQLLGTLKKYFQERNFEEFDVNIRDVIGCDRRKKISSYLSYEQFLGV